MYFLFGILVLISFVFVILFSRRKKKKILCRLACMNPCEKENLLNSLLGPLGFYYESRWECDKQPDGCLAEGVRVSGCL